MYVKIAIQTIILKELRETKQNKIAIYIDVHKELERFV